MPARLGFDRRTARDEGTAPAVELKNLLERHLGNAAYEEACRLIDAMTDGEASDEPSRIPGSPRPGGAMDRGLRVYAMDSADPVRRMQDIAAAEREVAPIVGEVLGMDSAAGVFREACRRLGVDPRDIPTGGLPAVFRMARRANGGGGAPRPAMDARAAASFAREFPEVARIRIL